METESSNKFCAFKCHNLVISVKKRYLGRHSWAIGYGAWSTRNITDRMVDEYLEHHRKDKGIDENMILE